MNDVERNLRKNIGKKIKLARTKAEYTQEQLAEKLSLSTRYISQLERGVAFGSATTITSLCKVLNISSDFLFQDLIQNDTPILTDLVSEDFLDDYLKLNYYNKTVIDTITKELVKLQKSDANSIKKKA
jgi:transcriptional regulator with XRE-family HTH domain